MPSVIRAAEFFVVGGPVEPGQASYVVRPADTDLPAALKGGRICLVVGPPACGKTSLLKRIAAAERRAGTLVALVALRHAAGTGAREWTRAFAVELGAALAPALDVAAWWAAHESSSDAVRLEAFLAEVVNVSDGARVVVLVDNAEALLDPNAAPLLAVLTGSSTELEGSARLPRPALVLAGCVSARRLVAARAAELAVIELGDFTPDEAYGLAGAFGGDPVQAQALMDRICVWTGGQPYLTQKVARGVARKGGRLEDVERVVRDQLLAPESAASDPVLRVLAARLRSRGRIARRAVRIVERLGAGRRVTTPGDPVLVDELRLSGAVRADGEALLLTSRIVKELVVARWLTPARGARRLALVALVVLAVGASAGYWYLRYLPEDDLALLQSEQADLAAAENAFQRLRGLPGFAERAGALWRAALERESQSASTLAGALAVDTRLRSLSGQEREADRLLGDFWLRRAQAAAHAEYRDVAVLYALNAARLPGAEPRALATLTDLVGEDYAQLEGSARLAEVPTAWHAAFTSGSVASLTEGRLLRTSFGAAAPAPSPPVLLTALELTPLVRALGAVGEGTAGTFELTLGVDHPAPVEVLVVLTAPSGANVTAPLARGGTVGSTFSFTAAQGGSLAELADEGLAGTWQLTLVDRHGGNTGTLVGWSLTFATTTAEDDLSEAVPIPDPARVAEVSTALAAERALAWPRVGSGTGSLAVWNAAAGALEHDLELEAAPRDVVIDAAGTRAVTATARSLTVWDLRGGTDVARVATQTEFVLPPVFSADGDYVAIAERVDAGLPLWSVLRSADGALVASTEGLADAVSFELAADARYFVVRARTGALRALDVRTGADVVRLPLAPTVRVVQAQRAALFLTVGVDGLVTAWFPAAANTARSLGRTAHAATVSLSADGTRAAFTRLDGASAVLDVDTGVEIAVLRQPRAQPATTTALAADGAALVTQTGALLRLFALPASPAVELATPSVPTALALAADGEPTAVGFATGQARFGSVGVLAADELAWFGHRGPVTAVALRAGVAATGGADGFVRWWSVESGEPTGVVAQSAVTPISLVALSADGRYVASAADSVVRVAATDGVVRNEVVLDGPVAALEFAPVGTALAAAAARSVVITGPDGTRSAITAELAAPVTALAFAPNGERLVVGDVAGNLRLLNVSDGSPIGVEFAVPQRVRWLAFSDADTLLVATDSWLHEFAGSSDTEFRVRASRLVRLPALLPTLALTTNAAVRHAGFDARGVLVAATLGVTGDESGPRNATLLRRDWPALLGLRLDDNGEPVAR